jgi:hypothetical protein
VQAAVLHLFHAAYAVAGPEIFSFVCCLRQRFHFRCCPAQEACSNDAFRLWGPEIPDVDGVTACRVARKAGLSPGCRVFFRPGPEPVAETGAQA